MSSSDVPDSLQSLTAQVPSGGPSADSSNFSYKKSSPFTAQTSMAEAIANNIALFRILDANLDRAREGLRIIEEWCRFGLNDASKTKQDKHLRQSIGQWHTAEIRAARDTPGDLGTAITHPQETQRSSLADVLQVNLARTQEALRVLEEYGKLHSQKMAAECKQMSSQHYTLDSQMMAPLQSLSARSPRLQQLMQARTYLVTSPVPDILGVVEAALKGGIAIVQFRDKSADDE